ncbi:MAG: sialidase family protein [Phycisphaerae bacterium]|jgi:predicted neuraminidase
MAKTGTWRVEAAEPIFGEGQPFAQCHASTLVELPGDMFLAAWFGGTHEKHADVGIWLSRRESGRWSPPIQVAKVRPAAHWNPVLFAPPSGPVHLFFKVGDTIGGWETWLTTSADGGVSWSPPRELVPGDHGGRGPVKNKPIVLSDGTWLAPASVEPTVGGKKIWDAFTDRSSDGGRTWQASAAVPLDHAAFVGPGLIQPTLWESDPGHVHMLLRSSAGAIYRSDSIDAGWVWSPPYRTGLPGNNSGIDLAKLADGALVLAFNPVDVKVRTPLSLAISRDNGATWTDRLDLETAAGEYSYPAVIASGRGVALTYTWNRTRIAFWKGRFESQS